VTKFDAATAADLLVDSGLLWAINRSVLHPLGLALAVNMEGEDLLSFDLLETKDPSGMIFDAEAMAEGVAKHRSFMKHTGNDRVRARRSSLGYAVQGMGPPPKKR